MKPLFTVHAGEYLVGSYLEENFKDCNIWIPSKDTGIDILVTDKKNKKAVSIQVKFSKDFLVTHMSEAFQQELIACGWWTLNSEKIENSNADLWVFVLLPFSKKDIQFIIIEPKEIKERLDKIHGKMNTIQSYFWITKKGRCWESRGLKIEDQMLIKEDRYSNKDRDFSDCLNKWEKVTGKFNAQ